MGRQSGSRFDVVRYRGNLAALDGLVMFVRLSLFLSLYPVDGICTVFSVVGERIMLLSISYQKRPKDNRESQKYFQ